MTSTLALRMTSRYLHVQIRKVDHSETVKEHDHQTSKAGDVQRYWDEDTQAEKRKSGRGLAARSAYGKSSVSITVLSQASCLGDIGAQPPSINSVASDLLRPYSGQDVDLAPALEPETEPCRSQVGFARLYTTNVSSVGSNRLEKTLPLSATVTRKHRDLRRDRSDEMTTFTSLLQITCKPVWCRSPPQYCR
ncbi:hypothetical protein PoB_003639000 [Plakobranchus ocellatus]|uniref:Uncharacterized protein n=1 Tax=Plakobranchus ocellatus TaxID=259542 RepID=A0AAV4ASK8_9GAST|nr:hypothetical protein PoB_003639000 [Plakobranchus ocellatus]